MTDKILLDKNIVIDLISGREKRPKILDILKDTQKRFITTHTFTTCFYILRKSDLSKEKIYSHLCDFELLEINKIDYYLAFGIAKNLDDIEDCLELCTTKRNGMKILTADQKLGSVYSEMFDIQAV